MRNFIYLLFLGCTVALVSCKKNKTQQNIKQYDDAQIQAYIGSKGYTNMKRDTVGGDTTGIYYQIITPGTGAPIDYSTQISYVYTVQTVDGKYIRTDTIVNHAYGYLGSVPPAGLQLGIFDVIKRMGTKARLIIPSRLAYGTNGTGTDTNRIAGNQAVDFYINVLNNVSKDKNGVTYTNTIDNYDDISIQKYMSRLNLQGFTKVTSGQYAGMYYKIRTAGTGTVPITGSSIVNFDYRGQLLNGNIVEPSNYSTTNNITAVNTTYYLSTPVIINPLTGPGGQIPGLVEALMLGGSSGAELTIIVPSRLANGLPSVPNVYPANSCIVYDITIDTVTD